MIFFRVVPQCEHSLTGIKNIIQRQNFENIVRQMRTIESRLVLLNDKLMKSHRNDKMIPRKTDDRYPDCSNISKTDLLVEVAQLRAKNNKCTCQRKDASSGLLGRSLINNDQNGLHIGSTNSIKPIKPHKTNLISFPSGNPVTLATPVGQKTIAVAPANSHAPPKQILPIGKIPMQIQTAPIQVQSSNIIHIKPNGTSSQIHLTPQTTGLKKGTVRPSTAVGPPAKFAKVLIRDENGQGKTVLIPTDKLNIGKAVKNVKDPDFFLGNDDDKNDAQDAASSVKSEIIEDDDSDEDSDDIETIDTSNHSTRPRNYDEIVQNLIEEDTPYSTKTEVKAEPEDYHYPGLPHKIIHVPYESADLALYFPL